MNRDWMLKTLTKLGFKETDAQLYVHVASEGPQRAQSIAQALNLQKRGLYHSLRKLKRKGLVIGSGDRPAMYSVISFDRLLDILIKTQLKEAQRIELEKETLLNQWNTAMRQPKN
jgi:sugar-specific transcriptional regulator TrmB